MDHDQPHKKHITSIIHGKPLTPPHHMNPAFQSQPGSHVGTHGRLGAWAGDAFAYNLNEENARSLTALTYESGVGYVRKSAVDVVAADMNDWIDENLG